ncbi:MAG: hypothetical protein WEB58_04970 [Planctomycetaceae bacterium]
MSGSFNSESTMTKRELRGVPDRYFMARKVFVGEPTCQIDDENKPSDRNEYPPIETNFPWKSSTSLPS